jgi:ribosomal-protein-alanine N-acetyltransferase
MSQPTLKTSRLVLRPFRKDDAASVQRLAGEWEIADTTLNVPHPYENGLAEQWIETHGPGYEAEKLAAFAVVLRDRQQLIGAVSLKVDRDLNRADLGYWIGKPFWNLGYAAEAARAVIAAGFDEMGLNRICAFHFARNPSSGRVMEKLGMLLEGTARQHTMKWGKYEDLVSYGILREDWTQIKESEPLNVEY